MKSGVFATSLLLLVVGCGSEWENEKYYLAKTEETPINLTLYHKIGDGGHGRIEFVNRLGISSPYIYAEDKDGHYWYFDSSTDKEELNSNEIVKGPYTENEFNSIKSKLLIKGQIVYPH